MVSISIQTEDFDLATEYALLRQDSPVIGAIVTFCGLVRDFDQGKGHSLSLEHFPGMTEKMLIAIIAKAKQRWPIINARIVHRIGKLSLGEQVVFVGVNSEHRSSAFQACEFIIDFLKTQAPLWKKAHTRTGDYWIEAKPCDHKATHKWRER